MYIVHMFAYLYICTYIWSKYRAIRDPRYIRRAAARLGKICTDGSACNIASFFLIDFSVLAAIVILMKHLKLFQPR